MLFYYDALRCVDTNFTEGGLCGEETNHERGGAPAQAGQNQRMETGTVCFVCACFLICHITIATEGEGGPGQRARLPTKEAELFPLVQR